MRETVIRTLVTDLHVGDVIVASDGSSSAVLAASDTFQIGARSYRRVTCGDETRALSASSYYDVR